MSDPLSALIDRTADQLIEILRGGPGSGHFGHSGRPGEVGGSQPGDHAADSGTGNAPIGGHPETITGFHTLLPKGLFGGFDQRGPGKYIALDKPFFGDVGKPLWADVEIDPLRILDPLGIMEGTDSDASLRAWQLSAEWVNNMSGEEVSKRYGGAAEAINEWLQSHGWKGRVHWIEAEARERFGRELVVFDKSAVRLFDLDRSNADLKRGDEVTGRRYDFGSEDWVERGGPGSGHFGHEGRPGEVGGSQSGNGNLREYRDFGNDDSMARVFGENQMNAELDQQTAIWLSEYKTMYYRVVNDVLRGRAEADDFQSVSEQRIRESIEVIDAAIAESKAPQDLILYRAATFPQEMFDSLVEGSQWTDPGYVSTSLSDFKPMMYGTEDRTLMFRIRLAKGNNALYIDQSEVREQLLKQSLDPLALSEAEVLLPRGSTFRITHMPRLDELFAEIEIVNDGP